MSLTADEWARFRSYVPTSIAADTDEIEARVLALGSWQKAAIEYLRTFRAQLLVNPSSFSVPEYSESWSQNISTLDKLVAELEAQVPGAGDDGIGGTGVGRMVRVGHPRGGLR